jgi:hypothetical protein
MAENRSRWTHDTLQRHREATEEDYPPEIEQGEEEDAEDEEQADA